jgi:hypothetical protein
MSQSAVPKVRARVVGSSSIHPVRMTLEAEQAVKDVQEAFKEHGHASFSMIVRAALTKYANHVKATQASPMPIAMQAEWSVLSRKCHITTDRE